MPNLRLHYVFSPELNTCLQYRADFLMRVSLFFFNTFPIFFKIFLVDKTTLLLAVIGMVLKRPVIKLRLHVHFFP